MIILVSPHLMQLHIGKLMAVNHGTDTNTELLQQLEQARKELEIVKTTTTSGEYAVLIKTMRAEKKIKDIEIKMRGDRVRGQQMGAFWELVGGYILKAVLSLVLLYFSISYRYKPVLVFDDRFSFAPLEGILSFPTGVKNAISVPVWALACNVSFRKIAGFIKRKK